MCTRIKITSRNLHMRVTIKVAKKKKGATVTFSEYRTVSDLFIDKFDGHNGIIVHINTLRARRTFHGFQNMILFSVLKCIVWTSQAIIDSLCNAEKENWNEKKKCWVQFPASFLAVNFFPSDYLIVQKKCSNLTSHCQFVGIFFCEIIY